MLRAAHVLEPNELIRCLGYTSSSDIQWLQDFRIVSREDSVADREMARIQSVCALSLACRRQVTVVNEMLVDLEILLTNEIKHVQVGGKPLRRLHRESWATHCAKNLGAFFTYGTDGAGCKSNCLYGMPLSDTPLTEQVNLWSRKTRFASHARSSVSNRRTDFVKATGRYLRTNTEHIKLVDKRAVQKTQATNLPNGSRPT